jgi:hypothetical protein
MQGVTTAIVAFLFVGIIFPTIIRNKPQYYWSLAFTVFIILLDALAHSLNSGGFYSFVYVVTAFLQVAAIVLLILSAGGMTHQELTAHLLNAFEAMRSGETEPTVIVPMRGEVPQEPEDEEEEELHPRIELETPAEPAVPPAEPTPDTVPGAAAPDGTSSSGEAKQDDGRSPLPLE